LADLFALGAFVLVAPGLGNLLYPSILAAAAAFLALVGGGSLRPRLAPELGREGGRLAAQVTLPILLVTMALGRSSLASLDHRIAVAVGFVFGGRFVSYRILPVLRRRRWLVERTVLVGSGPAGLRLAQALVEHPEYGLEIAGVVDDAPPTAPIPWLGSIDRLWDVVAEQGVRRLIVCFSTTTAEELVGVLRASNDPKLVISIVPRLFELPATPRSVTEWVWGVPLVPMRSLARHRLASWNKRVLDVMAATLLLPFAAPLLVAIAVAVRFTSPGPILFRQRRVGRGGRCFEMVKFRSMQLNDQSDTQWAVAGGNGLTPVGRVLRDTCLDELPQLFNVLRGDMSLVGPRPERPHFVEQFGATISNYHHRHRVRPGLTGWAQIHGLYGDTSIEDRVRFDNHYIEHWSLAEDLRILATTSVAVFRRTRRGEPWLPPPGEAAPSESRSSRRLRSRTTFRAGRPAAISLTRLPRRQSGSSGTIAGRVSEPESSSR
jgi:exopolysaccharide biosynthesis polyprenyl glycosylphosphotransferase